MFLVITCIVLLADYYFYSATKSLVETWSWGKYVKMGFWLTTIILLSGFGIGYFLYITGTPVSGKTRGLLMGLIFVMFVPRLVAIGVFVIDDIIRLGKYMVSLISSSGSSGAESGGLYR